MKNIAVFVSGSGSNAENIINHFAQSPLARVNIVLSNKPDAYALTRAQRLGVDTFVFTRNDFYDTSKVVDLLENRKIDYIVLAGFLWLVPDNITKTYHNRVINIHPALLPKYGGRGMYGDAVHKAVVAAHEPISGITIHKVNSEYDSGDTIFQAKVPIDPNDTYQDVAAKIHTLEQKHFPTIIEEEIKKL